jgi:hypothetical protein
MTSDGLTPADVDDEHTRLLTYRSAAAGAADRIDVLAIFFDGLAPVLALAPSDGADGAGPAEAADLADALSVASTAQMMNQANFRAALSTLVSPVQRSLVTFVG